MEDEQEDVKKMTDFINKQKLNYQNNYDLEFQDFVNFKQDYNSDQDYDDELIDEPDEVHINTDVKYHIEKVSVCTLTEEEQQVIESCTDPDLKKLLILNRSKNVQLINLHKKMQQLMLECEEEIEEKRDILKNAGIRQVNQQTCVWKLAAPYFKDKKFFSSPLNSDALHKRSQNELSVYDIVPSPKWTPIEFDRLINAVKCNYNINRQNEVVCKLNALKAKVPTTEIENTLKLEEITNLQEQLEVLKDDEKVPPLNLNECITWYKVAETFLKDRHTALECQSVWHMLVHPVINKTAWTEEENTKLEEIAKRYSYQNWDAIALELNNNRTGFTTCLHYFSKLCDKFKKSKFTAEEDSFLIDVVLSYKIGNYIPWHKVVCHFSNRSRHQLYHRYKYFLSQNHVKKGKFSEAEDVLLMILVQKFGRNFKKCSEYMPHRSQVQLKSRYNSNLQKHIKKGTFTSEDDEIIYNYAEQNGEKSWSGLTHQLNRCNAQIRQRYKLIKTFLRDNPNAKVSDIPKRRHRFDEVNDQFSFLNYVVDQYKDNDFIPTISMIEETLQVELRTPTSTRPLLNKTKKAATDVKVKNIDAMLTDFFSSSMTIQQNINVTSVNLIEAGESAEEILSTLGVTLNIPQNLECGVHLDNIDLEILERLSKKSLNYNPPKMAKLISPNLSTLVGLRSLIIKHKEYKQQQKDPNLPSTSKCDKVVWPMEQNLLKLDSSNRTEILFHRDLFSKRFETLFNWSAVLSLEKPNQFTIPEASPSTVTPVALTRVYHKRPSIEGGVVVKKRKVDMSALTALSQQSKNSQLKLVDKSVVERLMKKKSNINIIRLDTIVGSNASIAPIIKKNSSVVRTQNVRKPESNSLPKSSTITRTTKDVVNEDLEDVERLNVVLKSVKSEATSDTSTWSSEEFQAIRGDVQLLKEILKYEKVKVKSEPGV